VRGRGSPVRLMPVNFRDRRGLWQVRGTRLARYRAVLFDLFDTLCRIDEAIYADGKRRAARALGVPPDPFVRAWVASGDDAQVGRLPDIPARVRKVCEVLGAPPPDATVLGRVTEIERATLSAATVLYPDARPVLEDLRARPALGLGLVSNASSPSEALFGHLGLSRYFDAVSWSFRVGVAKPGAAIYLDACRALGVGPGDCLFVGDGNARELDGARDLGMTAVRIERVFSLGPYRKEESRGFDASIADLRALPSLYASDLPAA
jgi:putative hydrolase of the HAD superfamily